MAFIAIDGPKHAGKTSVARRLELDFADLDAVFTKEPTPSFDCSFEESRRGQDLAQAILDDRLRHVNQLILPSLETGRTVVSERYLMSGLVFQSLDGVSMAETWRTHTGVPLPDLQILILSDPETLADRSSVRGAPTRIESEAPRGEEVLLYLAAARILDLAGVRTVVFYNGPHSRTIDEVSGEVYAALQSLVDEPWRGQRV